MENSVTNFIGTSLKSLLRALGRCMNGITYPRTTSSPMLADGMYLEQSIHCYLSTAWPKLTQCSSGVAI